MTELPFEAADNDVVGSIVGGLTVKYSLAAILVESSMHTRREERDGPGHETAIEFVELEHVGGVMYVDGDRVTFVELELSIVGQDFARRGTRVLDLDATVGRERCGVEGEGAVRVKVVFAVLPYHDGSGAMWLRCCRPVPGVSSNHSCCEEVGSEPLALNRY
jgi:hypothetical protein